MAKLENLPPNMVRKVIGDLNNEALARLGEVSKEYKNLTKLVLNQRRMQKIQQHFRKNKKAVFHNNENVQHNIITNKMLNNEAYNYKVGDVVMFKPQTVSTREHAFAVVSFNKNAMRKILVSNEGLTYVGYRKKLPNYVVNHVRTLDYTNVEKQIMKKFGASNSNNQLKDWVKTNLIGTPDANIK